MIGRSRIHRYSFLAVITAALVPTINNGVVRAQLFDRATVIENARIISMSGPEIENGSVVIKGGRIQAIGSSVKAPMFASKIDAAGMVITPGFVDAWSALGQLRGASGSTVTGKSSDSFDYYAADLFQDAYRNGVTSVFVAPPSGAGVLGVGSVIRLASRENGGVGKVVKEDAALCISLGSRDRAIQRLKTFQKIRKQFKAALAYRESLEDYEEDLKEYMEKLEERRKAKEKEEDAEGEAGKTENDESEDSPDDSKDDDDPPDEEEKPKPKEDKTISGTSRSADSTAFFLGDRVSPKYALQARRFGGEENDDDESNETTEGDSEEGGDGDDEEELEKPEKPEPDRGSDVLLRVIDHELPVRIEANRSEDIFNALDLAEEFNFDFTLVGAADAYLVAERLAEREVAVILEPAPPTELFRPGATRRYSHDSPAILAKAGVSWIIGSGGASSAAARFVGLSAQRAAGVFGEDSWLRIITVSTADALGVGGQMGRLRRGMNADILVWSGDPSEPSSRIVKVYVAGKLVFDAEANGE